MVSTGTDYSFFAVRRLGHPSPGQTACSGCEYRLLMLKISANAYHIAWMPGRFHRCHLCSDLFHLLRPRLMIPLFYEPGVTFVHSPLVKEEKLCYDIRVVGMNMSEAGLSEWQTRWTQNPLMATSCGFKSRGRHSLAGAKPLNPKHLGFSGFVCPAWAFSNG